MSLFHEKFQLENFLLCAGPFGLAVNGLIVTADDLLFGGFPAGFVVNDTVSCHIDTHISWGLIWALSEDALEDCTQHRENLHISVIVYRSFTVSVQMEGVNHIYVIQICCRRFVCQVYRMLQRDIPDWEGLEFCIACMDPSFVLVVELGQTGGHFSASGTGCCDNHKGSGGFNVLVFAVAFITHDEGNIAGVSFYGIVQINFDAQFFQLIFVFIGAVLPGILGDDNASHIKASASEGVYQAEHINIISNA